MCSAHNDISIFEFNFNVLYVKFKGDSINIFRALKDEDFSGQTGCSFRFDAAVACGSTTGVFHL